MTREEELTIKEDMCKMAMRLTPREAAAMCHFLSKLEALTKQFRFDLDRCDKSDGEAADRVRLAFRQEREELISQTLRPLGVQENVIDAIIQLDSP